MCTRANGDLSSGPLLKLPPNCVFCPSATDEEVECADDIDDDDGIEEPEMISRRDLARRLTYHMLEKRKKKEIDFCDDLEYESPQFDSSGEQLSKKPATPVYGYKNPSQCDDYDFGIIPKPPTTNKYATEHILEFQLIKIFIEAFNGKSKTYKVPGEKEEKNFCAYMKHYWAGKITLDVEGDKGTPLELLPKVYPGNANNWADEWVVLDTYVNGMKERVSIPSFFRMSWTLS